MKRFYIRIFHCFKMFIPLFVPLQNEVRILTFDLHRFFERQRNFAWISKFNVVLGYNILNVLIVFLLLPCCFFIEMNFKFIQLALFLFFFFLIYKVVQVAELAFKVFRFFVDLLLQSLEVNFCVLRWINEGLVNSAGEQKYIFMLLHFLHSFSSHHILISHCTISTSKKRCCFNLSLYKWFGYFLIWRL